MLHSNMTCCISAVKASSTYIISPLLMAQKAVIRAVCVDLGLFIYSYQEAAPTCVVTLQGSRQRNFEAHPGVGVHL